MLIQNTDEEDDNFLNSNKKDNYNKNFLLDFFLENEKEINENTSLNYLTKEEVKIENIFELIYLSTKLGLISIGGHEEHIHIIKQYFVKEKNYIINDNYYTILEMCLFLPGFCSSNLLATLCTINTKNILKGFIALIFYNLPSFLMLLILSYFFNLIKFYFRPKVSNYNPNGKYYNFFDDTFLYSLMALAAGICEAALAMLLCSAKKIAYKLSNSRSQFIILFISCIIYYINTSYTLMIIVILLSGLISQILGDHDYLYQIRDTTNIGDNIFFTGYYSLTLYIIIFAIFSILNSRYNNIYLFLIENFLKIGAVSIGEGHVIIPMIYSIFKYKMEESEVLNGYALVSLLPGSLFNISTYTGVITSNSLIGGLIGGLFVYIPGYLLILFCLPYIKNIRNNNKFQYFIRGANSSALGFIFSVAIDLWIDSCFVNPYTDPIMGTLIMFFCIILINLFKIHKTIILLIGASLNLIIRICYNLIIYYHIHVGVTIPASIILNNTIGNITNTTLMTNNTNIR